MHRTRPYWQCTQMPRSKMPAIDERATILRSKVGPCCVRGGDALLKGGAMHARMVRRHIMQAVTVLLAQQCGSDSFHSRSHEAGTPRTSVDGAGPRRLSVHAR
jgi:hypothetical protein